MKKLLIIPLLFLFGCSASYKAQRDTKKLGALAVQYPNELARLSNWLYPCFSGPAKSDTVFSTHTDTLMSEGSTVTVRLNDTVFVTKTPPGKVITKTNTITIHDTIADNRYAQFINTQYEAKKDSLSALKALYINEHRQKNKFQWLFIGSIALIIGWLFYSVYKTLSGGGLLKLFKR